MDQGELEEAFPWWPGPLKCPDKDNSRAFEAPRLAPTILGLFDMIPENLKNQKQCNDEDFLTLKVALEDQLQRGILTLSSKQQYAM